MKRLFFAVSLITIVSCAPRNYELFLDNQQVAISKNDFNIVLITIDALRADHLSCYGYQRKTSPAIDKIAEKGIIFKNAIAPCSWTAPSMVSLFTSLYPVNHGVIHSLGGGGKVYMQDVFSDKLTTLTEVLKAQGYATFGVASNLHLSEHFGFGRGFDYFECLPWSDADRVNEVVYSWEKEIKKSAKFFLWIHYFDPHGPYLEKSPWIAHYTEELPHMPTLNNELVREVERLYPTLKKEPGSAILFEMLEMHLTARYDSEVNYADSYIGHLIDRFGLGENSLIIITSDHGEEFFERGNVGHGNNLYHETIHIPLILKLPYNVKGEILEEHVNLVDIMPSILHLLDINPPGQTLGKSFWEGKMSSGKEPLAYKFSELDNRPVKFSNLKTIMTSPWKYIYNYQDNTEELYNISIDPGELNNLAGKEQKRCNQMKGKLFEWVSDAKKYPVAKQPFTLSQEEKEKLKQLGYIK